MRLRDYKFADLSAVSFDLHRIPWWMWFTNRLFRWKRNTDRIELRYSLGALAASPERGLRLHRSPAVYGPATQYIAALAEHHQLTALQMGQAAMIAAQINNQAEWTDDDWNYQLASFELQGAVVRIVFHEKHDCDAPTGVCDQNFLFRLEEDILLVLLPRARCFRRLETDSQGLTQDGLYWLRLLSDWHDMTPIERRAEFTKQTLATIDGLVTDTLGDIRYIVLPPSIDADSPEEPAPAGPDGTAT